MMERIRKEMILMERGLHSPTAGKRLSNLSDSAGNAVLEALENSPHSGRLSPRLTAASLHSAIGDISAKGKFEIDTLFNLQHPSSESTVSSEIPPSESRKKISLYSEVAQEADMNSDVEVGCSALRSPASLTSSQLKENSNKGYAESSPTFYRNDMKTTFTDIHRIFDIDYLINACRRSAEAPGSGTAVAMSHAKFPERGQPESKSHEKLPGISLRACHILSG
ncbi:homeobox even-skipped homolog protein 2 [Geospiza fortis]|uniref:Homeobox even-skipped homolog protein 2 n=1 Tax=Geospiza fortis TaxID=48883 RepID=A0A8N5EUC4_GEOFO|nr:homeobox even-skipped homolog protein 2 [Geospiza fortis]